MQSEHWGAMARDEESSGSMIDKYVPISAKKQKFEELRQRDELHLPYEKHNKIKLNSPLITQTIEVMKQTEVLQSLIDTYSYKNVTSNTCEMIPEVEFPPENAADLVGEQKLQKPIWFAHTVDTALSRGDPQSYPEISSNICRQTLRKVMCGLLRMAGFTDCSETAIILLSDAAEEFLSSLVSEYRGCYDMDDRLEKTTMLRLLPLEKAYFSMTGTSLMQVHNYYKHKVLTRNRAEIAEFNSGLQEYNKLMKKSQSSMQKYQLHQKDNEMQPDEDCNASGTGSSSMININDP